MTTEPETTTFTPGPWRVEPDLSSIGKAGVTMSNGNALGTADDYEWGYLRIEDARLIAAAPDLLAALKLAMAHSDELEARGIHRTSELLPIYQAARAAIAKAEQG